MRCVVVACLAIWSLPAQAAPATAPVYGPELQGFAYPFPISCFRFTSQNEPLEMPYMDVRPQAPNGQTVVLLHGKTSDRRRGTQRSEP
jgi:hypothetical protein